MSRMLDALRTVIQEAVRHNFAFEPLAIEELRGRRVLLFPQGTADETDNRVDFVLTKIGREGDAEALPPRSEPFLASLRRARRAMGGRLDEILVLSDNELGLVPLHELLLLKSIAGSVSVMTTIKNAYRVNLLKKLLVAPLYLFIKPLDGIMAFTVFLWLSARFAIDRFLARGG